MWLKLGTLAETWGWSIIHDLIRQSLKQQEITNYVAYCMCAANSNHEIIKPNILGGYYFSILVFK